MPPATALKVGLDNSLCFSDDGQRPGLQPMRDQAPRTPGLSEKAEDQALLLNPGFVQQGPDLAGRSLTPPPHPMANILL